MTSSDTLAQSAVKGENINFPSFVKRQNNTTNVIEVGNLMIQMGWGYVQGSGTASKEEKPVTFPQAFSAEPILVVSTPGSSSSVPVKISDLNTSGAGGTATSGQRDANARNVTTTGFDAVVSDRGALSTGVYVGFSWIAIGPA